MRHTPLLACRRRGHDAVTPGAFGLIQGVVREVEESPKIFHIVAVLRQTNAAGDVEHVAAGDGKLLCGNTSSQALSDKTGPVESRLCEHDAEFFAAVSPGNIGGTDGIPDNAGDGGKHCIAHAVAVGIIDVFEVVQV
jgi:hypothetical protein